MAVLVGCKSRLHSVFIKKQRKCISCPYVLSKSECFEFREKYNFKFIEVHIWKAE
jgi:hypothetical protein